MRLIGEVVRFAENGVGVRFIDIDAETRKQLADFVIE